MVELFAYLHDAKRMNNGRDPEHGLRASVFARGLAGDAFTLPAASLELLVEALRGHTDGLTTGDVTVLTCWDSDRLDLGRVGIMPHPDRLCTEAAKDPGLMKWANGRSRGRLGPGEQMSEGMEGNR